MTAFEHVAVLDRAAIERKQARRENWQLLRRRPGFIIGTIVVGFWVACAILYK